MKAAIPILAAIFAATLHAAAAEAQDGVQLSPGAMQQLQEQQPEPSAPRHRDGYEFRDTPDGGKDGVSYHAGDVYLGTFRRSTSPTTGRLKHWVFDRGVYVQRNGDRYAGTFYFFHFIYDELTKEPSVLPRNGTYIMVGDYLPKSGAAQPGIYYGNVLNYQPMRWIEASEAYLADFERGHQEQVALYAEKIRRDRAAEAAEAESGLSFGQVLALGLGAAGIAAADIPAADALQIGSGNRRCNRRELSAGPGDHQLPERRVADDSAFVQDAGLPRSDDQFRQGLFLQHDRRLWRGLISVPERVRASAMPRMRVALQIG
jgi:hypothetical protein